MRGDGPLLGGRGAVSTNHLRRAPPEQAHQVGLRAVGGLPAMGERVPQLVWVDLADPGRDTSPLA